MAKTIKTTFSTAQFVRNTGRQPNGHGAWAFSVTADLKTGGEERMAGMLFSKAMTQTEAKKWATEEAASWLRKDLTPTEVGELVKQVHIEVLPQPGLPEPEAESQGERREMA